MSRRWILVGVLGLSMLVAAYFGSPYLAAHNLRNAAISADIDRLTSVVDFPAVRESLKAQVNAAMTEKLSNDASMQNNPFAGLATIMIPAMVDKAVDSYVTPEAFSRLVEEGKLKNDGAVRENPDNEYIYNYRDLDHFSVGVRAPNTRPDEVPTFVLERRGMFSWKVIRVVLPPALFRK